MEFFWEVLFWPLVTLVLPLVFFGLIIGRTVEKRHFKRLDEKEEAYRDVLVTQLKSYPNFVPFEVPPTAVTSQVVIGSDYLKSWLSAWRKLFGGEMKSLRLIQERAKREAIVRLIESARDLGFNAVCNVRISGADIGGNTSGGKNKVPMAAVIATGTAYRAAE